MAEINYHTSHRSSSPSSLAQYFPQSISESELLPLRQSRDTRHTRDRDTTIPLGSIGKDSYLLIYFLQGDKGGKEYKSRVQYVYANARPRLCVGMSDKGTGLCHNQPLSPLLSWRLDTGLACSEAATHRSNLDIRKDDPPTDSFLISPRTTSIASRSSCNPFRDVHAFRVR